MKLCTFAHAGATRLGLVVEHEFPEDATYNFKVYSVNLGNPVSAQTTGLRPQKERSTRSPPILNHRRTSRTKLFRKSICSTSSSWRFAGRSPR